MQLIVVYISNDDSVYIYMKNKGEESFIWMLRL